MVEQITNIDFCVLDFIQSHVRCAFLDFFMPLVSSLGNGGLIWLFLAAVMLLREKYRKQGFVLLVGLAAGFVLGNLLLKPLIARPRPNWVNLGVELLIDNPLDFSFPSGHTLSSFVAAFLISMDNHKFGYAAIPFAALMAFSRLYLYVHYPSDVLAAVVLAFFIALAVHRLFYRKKQIQK